jgi:hypothetical protein
MNSDSDKTISLKRFFAVIRQPLFFIVINFFLVNTLFSLLPYDLGDIVYTTGRIAIIFYAGWLVIRRNIGGLWQSALVGMAMYFVDHVALKGGVFLLNYIFNPGGMGLAAFGSVIFSFIMFIPLAMLVGATGGLAARSRGGKSAFDDQ